MTMSSVPSRISVREAYLKVVSSLELNIHTREQKRDLTKSYDKSHFTNGNVKGKVFRLHSGFGPDLGRSVGVTMATQLGYAP